MLSFGSAARAASNLRLRLLLLAAGIVCCCGHELLTIDVVNLHSVPLNIYWQSSHGPVKVLTVDAGCTQPLTATAGHAFVAASPLDGDAVVAEFSARAAQPLVRLAPPAPHCSPDESVDLFPGVGYCSRLRQHSAANGSRQILTLEEFHRRSADEIVLRDREFSHLMRLQLNREQPARVPKFTPRGFELRELPHDLWQLLQSFWTRNAANQTLEPWSPGDSYTNHWISPIYLVPLPQSLRRRILRTLQPILEQWSGLQLEATSCYGIRVYRNNSILEDHVDRVETHVVSAILQVAQDVDNDWPLDIVGHRNSEDGATAIVLKPRDVLMYESAACIHGRSRPMRGSYYANVFVHFKPAHDWNFTN